jgi:hypothetical protein
METLLSMKCLCFSGSVICDKVCSPYEQVCVWKCVISEEINDSVILKNRQLMTTGHGINIQGTRNLNRFEQGL